MNTLRDEAIVLRTYKSGESDRVVVLWTKSHGKLRGIAKGVRKTTSKLGSGLEVMAHVDILLAASKGELYQVRQVQHVNRFSTVRQDFDRLSAGLALVEVVDAVPTDNVPDEEIFTMLARALLSLDNEEFSPFLVPSAFFFKMLALDGSMPQLSECVSCGAGDPLVSFNAEVGGLLCAACRSGRPVSKEAIVLLRRLLHGDLAAVLREGDVLGTSEVVGLASEAIEQHFGKRLKVARSLNQMLPPEGFH